MTRDFTYPRLRRAAALGTRARPGAAGSPRARNIRPGVPNGGGPEGAVKCAAGNPNTARFSQNCGALVTLTSGDTRRPIVQDRLPTAESAYRARFYVNLRTLSMGEAAPASTSSPPMTAPIRCRRRPPATRRSGWRCGQRGGKKQLSAYARLNSGNETAIADAGGAAATAGGRSRSTGPGPPGRAPTTAISASGWTARRQTGLTGLNNDPRRSTTSRWGAVAGLDAGTSGSFRLDDFASQRTGYIGPRLAVLGRRPPTASSPFIQGLYAAEITPAARPTSSARSTT